jgi:hypothetical protein
MIDGRKGRRKQDHPQPNRNGALRALGACDHRGSDQYSENCQCDQRSVARPRAPRPCALGLLIACANTGNLVLARTIARRKELAIRAALGASSRQVLGPVLTETTMLAVLGGALGLIVARAGQSLVTHAFANQLPRATEVQMDARVLAFTLVVSVLTGLSAGVLAGTRLLRGDLNDSLK